MASEWQDFKVEDVAAPTKNALVGGPFGSNLVSADYTPSGIPVIRGQNMGFGRWVSGEFAFVSEEKADELAANIARPGDIVFTQRGTLGQVAIVPDGPYDRYVISQSQMKLTVDPEKADTRFLYYVFTSQEQQDYIRQNAIQTGVPHTNLGILRNTPLWLPSPNEQIAIADILSSLDDKIELNRQMNATLEAMARALFQSWFVDFDPVRAKAAGESPVGMDAETAALFPDSFENSELGPIPQGWRVSQIGIETTVVGGSTPSTSEPGYWDGGTIAWATPKDLSNLQFPILLQTSRLITDVGLSQISSGLLPVGTVLLSSRAPIGYLALAEIPVAINQGFIAMICDKALPNHYVLLWTEANMEAIKGHANGTTFQEISKGNFRPLPVLVPDPIILNSFNSSIQGLFDRILSNTHEEVSLSQLRSQMLPELVSGNVQVTSSGSVGEHHDL